MEPNYQELLKETLELHDQIDRIASSTYWSGCECDHGEDGRVFPRIGPKCKRCVADDRIREIKELIDFDRPKREQKAKEDSLNSASL